MKSRILSEIFKSVLVAFVVCLFLGSTTFAAEDSFAGKVNINQATVKELTALPGIGKKKAEAIVEYRSENGQFSSVDDLKKVSGIGKKSLDKIKDYLTVEGG